MTATRNIYLTGFSGTGKSTAGQLLSARLGLPFRDLDDAIAAAASTPIPAIFAAEGEDGFRRRERAALQEAATGGGAIVSTGGGIVVDPANRALMRESGWVICLEALPETILARVAAHRRAGAARAARPLLDAPDPPARIRDLKASRQAAYADAHWTVHTDHLTPEQIAGEIARAVSLLDGAAGTPGAADRPSGFRFGAKWFGRDRPIVCVPIVARTPGEAAARARAFAALAPDALELRADWLADLTPEVAVAVLSPIAALGLPVIFTNRAEAEGGARPQDEGERLAIVAAAAESGLPALVDLELATAAPARARLIATARRRGVPVMLSHHDFAATPDEATLAALIEAMAQAGADAAKIAVMARDADDANRLLAVCRAATGGGAGIPLAAMAMGPAGAIARVLGHRAGSALTFAAASAEQGSAPGQLSLAQLRACWAVTALGGI